MFKVTLPDYENEDQDSDNYSAEKLRTRYKEKGLQPIRPWVERTTFINNTGTIIEPYVPPEGDGKISPISAAVKSKIIYFNYSVVNYNVILYRGPSKKLNY